MPRDRQSSFDPHLIAKYQRRFPGFDEKIISMYARGMSVREIVGHLRDLYGVDVSPGLISTVTDAVLDEVAAWQGRPLEPVYPLVFFDALRVKIRDEGLVRNKAVYVALGVRADGTKEILGLWLEQNEGAKFWLRVMNELKTRGVEDILIAIVDGLKGFPEAIVAVFPQATVQTCIVHLLRHSLEFASYKDRKAVAAALKDIYRAIDAATGEAALAAFEASPWGRKYPAIGQSWRRAWAEVVPFYAFHPDVRRLVYTTNAIEALNSKLRRAVRARGHFPTDEAAMKLLFLVLNRSEKEWTMPAREWSLSRNSLNDQRIDGSLPVQGTHGCVDCAVEGVGISEGLMGQMARLEIVPDNLDVVEFGCVFWQPLDGEPVFARLDGFKSELADMDRPVVLDQYDRFYCPSWLRTEQVVELLEVSDEVAAALGLARMHNQLARDMIE